MMQERRACIEGLVISIEGLVSSIEGLVSSIEGLRCMMQQRRACITHPNSKPYTLHPKP
jgi:hypothetical protein